MYCQRKVQTKACGNNKFLVLLLLPAVLLATGIRLVCATEGNVLPGEWLAFGPVDIKAESAGWPEQGLPDRDALLPGPALANITEELEIDGDVFQSRKVVFDAEGRLDLGELFGGVERGKTVYLLAGITNEHAVNMQFGAGADWWMQWWVDGEPIYDTLETGNQEATIASDNHVFELNLAPGEHVLAVAVISGSRDFILVAGDPHPAEKKSEYRVAMDVGRRILAARPASGHERPKIDFQLAAEKFRQAVDVASNDRAKAAALLSVGENLLNDYRETDYEAIRKVFAQVLTLEDERRREKAEALLGIGETYIREQEYARGREMFEESLKTFPCPNLAVKAQYALAWSFLPQRRYADAKREFEKLLSMEQVDSHLAWRSRALLKGIEQVPVIRRDRPRMFFNAETWPVVKARLLDRHESFLESIKERTDELVVDSLAITDYGTLAEAGYNAMDAALVYLVAGDQTALHKVSKLLRAIVDSCLERSVIRGRIYPLVAAAAAFDWVSDDLPADKRDLLARDMVNYVHSMGTEDWVQRRWRQCPGNYYIRNIHWYFGLATLDNQMEDLVYARNFEALSRGFMQYNDFLEDAVNKGKKDGAIRTALEYYFAATLNTLWPFLYNWQSAMNKPVPPDLIFFLTPDYILRNVLALNPPNHFRHFGYGRSWRSRHGMRANLLYGHLEHIIHFFSDSHPEYGDIARQLCERWEAKNMIPALTQGMFPLYSVLMDLDKTSSAGIPDGMPLARHFEYVGQILMSSGFDTNDVYALFSCGGNQDEADFDATHFTIYKQGYLALDSGTRAQTQPWPGIPASGPQREIALAELQAGDNYTRQTVAHNCVLIYMEGEEFPGGALNSGGQNRHPREAVLLAFESDRLFAYMATDATPVYHKDKCAEMIRQLVFIPPDHFVIFDRVTSRSANYPKTWLLHTANEPLISGMEFSALQNQGKILCRTLMPADAVFEKVGGPDREFWAAGQNWPIPRDSPYLRTIGTDSEDNIPESIGRWRVEVKPGAAREQDYFLHLIQTSDRIVETMAECTLVENKDLIGLSFSTGNRTWTVKFNRIGEVGGNIEMLEAGEKLIDRQLTQDVMRQEGLALTEY